MSTNQTIIQCRDLSFSYDLKPVLSHINCEIYKNDLVSVVGPNGGGKSTFIRLIAGILQPDSGEVTIHGAHKVLAGAIGYVPQSSSIDQKFPLTVYDVALSGTLKLRAGFYTQEQKARALLALENVNMLDYKKSSFSDLSGGQQRRVIIARALAAGSEILLLDEPTANLDQQSSTELIKLIHHLNQNMTIVLVTHDYSFVSDITTRVFCISDHFHEHPLDEASEQFADNFRLVNHKVVLNRCDNCKRHQ